MASLANQAQAHQQWYQENKAKYEACGDAATRLLTQLLRYHKIPFHSINYRVKAEQSFLNKCRNGKYTNPTEEITDVCGIRIISFTNSDVERICKIIEKEFNIDSQNSVNKGLQLGTDKVGYLSVHYVVTINGDRAALSEYALYKDLKFEIQIRTLLQHAWAEIEHDRSYKFSGELPAEIKRRFYLIAGALELMDREFDRLSGEIDQYAAKVKSEAKKGNLDAAIDSTSLLEYLSVKLTMVPDDSRHFHGQDKQIIRELQIFGINKLKELDAIITDRMMKNPSWKKQDINYLGMLRDIMILHDPQKYFEEVWRHNWECIDKKEFEDLVSINPDVQKYQNLLSFTDGMEQLPDFLADTEDI